MLGEQGFKMPDDEPGQPLEILAGLFEVGLDLGHLLAVLANVKEGDPADADLEQALDIGFAQFPLQLFPERLEAFGHG